MKTFGTVRNTLDAFVAGHSDGGRNSNGSLYFDGSVLYSYGPHYVIAALSSDGKEAFLNVRKVSVTTSKHLNMVHDMLVRSGYSITFTGDPVASRDTVNAG